MTKEDEVPQYPLYHGIRTNKTSDQIKKEGFCSFSTEANWKREIMLALKYFGKEKLAATSGGKGTRIKMMLSELKNVFRGDIWASTNKESACIWWAHANPESISLLLHQLDIQPDKIDKYLSERFGRNCYNIKLKITSTEPSNNFRIGLKCIPPYFIDSIERCEDCEYTGKSKITIKKSK